LLVEEFVQQPMVEKTMLLRAERRHCSVQNQTIDANVDATVTRCEQQTHSASTQTW